MIKMKNSNFGKKSKKKLHDWAPNFPYIYRGVIQKDNPEKEKRGAGNEKVTMAENESWFILGSPNSVSDESTERRFVYRLMVLPERYGGNR
jgi:hypothetical protein